MRRDSRIVIDNDDGGWCVVDNVGNSSDSSSVPVLGNPSGVKGQSTREEEEDEPKDEKDKEEDKERQR
ncbi:hypothetical protein HZH66_010682 [Vespula vulgaris]|uniref:Uncharacterized protein n=1 Tax=Vespula vulgaris TaxID=7454 RepID=A0A834MWJ7_VESVU|nr:hypothetical protein HZH66_010682 [Vespula vulgaris]